MEDGLQIVFSHRSFQEYFVALYLNDAPPEIQEGLIDRYWPNIRSDRVIYNLHEMNPELIERLLFIPVLTKLFEDLNIRKKVGITHFSRYLKLFFSEIKLNEGQLSLVLIPQNIHLYSLLRFFSSVTTNFKIPEKKVIRKESQNFIEKYSHGRTNIRYEIAPLTYRSEIVQDMSNLSGLHSISFIQKSYDSLLLLKKRHKQVKGSLDDVLGR